MFNPKKYNPVITVIATHPLYPGDEFKFFFSKELPEDYAETEKSYLGLPDDDRSEAGKVKVISMCGMLSVKKPEGFEEFPERDEMQTNFEDYYNKMSEGARLEFAAICESAWLTYLTSLRASSQVYLRQPEKDSTGNGVL